MRAFYFGTFRDAGHYLWDEHLQKLRLPVAAALASDVERPWDPLPWRRIDGKLNPVQERQGEALLHHLDGWTAIAFANRTDDTRPGSNSVFFFEAELDFDQALAEARERFPAVIERFDFEIVEGGIPKPARRGR